MKGEYSFSKTRFSLKRFFQKEVNCYDFPDMGRPQHPSSVASVLIIPAKADVSWASPS